MRMKLRMAITAALIASTGVLSAAVAPQAASAGCCIVKGERWFTGPTQWEDCVAAGEALLSSWDYYSCTRVDDRTHLYYFRIIS